jgi:predicted amidohydrolase YtcJ
MMLRISRMLASILGGLALAGCERAPADAPADLLFINGAIVTMDITRPRAEALAVRADRILAVGSRNALAALTGPQTVIVDLDGGALLPGFHDRHAHPIKGGLQNLGCSLAGLDEVAAILARVAACAAGTADAGGWVVGRGWSLGLFPEGNPHRSLLDDVVAERPVFLEAEDGHSAWVNSEALRIAGLDADTPDPPRGVIERDPETGAPSGTLRETAVDLVEALLPEIDFDMRLAALRLGVEEANRYGITAVTDASVGHEELAVYRALEAEDQFSLRVTAALDWPGPDADDAAFEQLLRTRTELTSPLIRLTSVKIFVDGVLEGDTAALLEPYLHRERAFSGELLLEPDQLADAVSRFDSLGLDVHLHAIGDRAVRAALDAVEQARERNTGRTHGRHQIAHLQLVHPDDYPRFAALDVAANFQALWAYPDPYINDINLPQVGPARVARMYPIGSLERAGATIVAGSDWPVSSMNPWDAIEVALTRQDPRRRHTGVLNASEAVGLDTMLAAFTREGGRVAGLDQITGMLRPGFAADLVWLEDDPHRRDAHGLANLRVRGTWFAGRRVFFAGD